MTPRPQIYLVVLPPTFHIINDVLQYIKGYSIHKSNKGVFCWFLILLLLFVLIFSLLFLIIKWNNSFECSVTQINFSEGVLFPGIFNMLKAESYGSYIFLIYTINTYSVLYSLCMAVASKHPCWYHQDFLILTLSYKQFSIYLWKFCCRAPFNTFSVPCLIGSYWRNKCPHVQFFWCVHTVFQEAWDPQKYIWNLQKQFFLFF